MLYVPCLLYEHPLTNAVTFYHKNLMLFLHQTVSELAIWNSL